MSRSLGDSCLDDIGVQPVPEVTLRALKPKDRFMVIASDGVWQGTPCVQCVYVCTVCVYVSPSLCVCMCIYRYIRLFICRYMS